MTLQLVHDAADVTALPIYNPHVIPEIARTFADKVEAGDFGQVDRCIVIVETTEGLVRLYWGGSIMHIEAVGVLQLSLADATQKALAHFLDSTEE